MEPLDLALHRRARRRLLVGLGVLVVLLAVPTGLFAWLQSAAGEAVLKERVLVAVRDALEGRLELDTVKLEGKRLHLEGLRLYTPEGELVAELATLDATVLLSDLLRTQVSLDAVALGAPRLYLVNDAQGLNLLRAVKTKGPSVDGPLPAWVVSVKSLTLKQGYVELSAGGTRTRLEALEVTGKADVALATLGVTGAFTLTGQLAEPLGAPVKLTFEADASKGATVASAQLTVKDSALKLHGDLGTNSLTLDELMLAPDTVRAVLPAWPVKVPLYATGSIDSVRVLISAHAGHGTLEARAAFQQEPLRIDTLELQAKALDLAQLVGAPKPSRLNVTAKGALSNLTADGLTGGLTVDAQWDTPQQARLLSLVAHLEAKGGTVRLLPLALSTPGAQLGVAGTASRKSLDLTGSFTATDLSPLPATVFVLSGVELPQLAGRGTLKLAVRGPAAHPAVKMVGQLSTLRLATVAAEQLDVELDLPDVLRPLDTDARLHASRVLVSGRAFDEVTLAALTHGREVDLNLTTKGLGDLKAHVTGTIDADSGGAQLASVQLTATNSAWVLEAPAHLTWAAGRLELEPLSLRDGAQHLVLQARQRGRRATGELHAQNIDLAKLPRSLAPASLGLTGVCSADVKADGALPTPEGELALRCTRGAVAGITDLDLKATARWQREQLVGQLEGSSAQGNVRADFDLPVRALLAGRAEPLSAKVKIWGVDVARLEPLVGQTLPVRGVLSLEVVAGGTGAKPTLTSTLTATTLDVAIDEHTLTVRTPRVEVKTRDDGTLQAQVSGGLLDGAVTLVLGTPLTVGSLLAPPDTDCAPPNPGHRVGPCAEPPRGVPTTAELQHLALSLAVDARDLDVHQFEALELVDLEGLTGRVSLVGALGGTLATPTGALTVSLARGAVPPLKQFDASVTLTATERETTVVASGRLGDKPALNAQVTVAAAVREFAQLDELGDRAATGSLVLSPVELTQFLSVIEGEPAPSGLVSAALDVKGTLDAPVLLLRAAVQSLKFDKVALGAARLELTGSGEAQHLSVGLEAGGDLAVKGRLELPLRLARVRDAAAWRDAALALSLQAHALDLAFLSGVHPAVRQAGGVLELVGQAGGTLGAPTFVGDAQLTKGRLALASFGDYHDLELDLHATNNLIEVKTLKLKAGAGGAQLKARLGRGAAGPFLLQAEGTADKLPIISDDQLLATASLALTVRGAVSPARVDLTAVDLPRVEVVLPELKRKDLQDLTRPKDVVVHRGGARAARKKLARALAAAPAPAPFVLTAEINARRNIWVRSTDLNVELELSDGFRVEVGDDAQVSGTAAIRQGTVEVIGRKFVVQKGSTAAFDGPPEQPVLNLAAVHTNEKEQIKVTITVVGRGADIVLKATSVPPLPESEIYTLLATGRLKLERGSGASFTAADAASVVGQLAATQVKTMLAKKLPIDVLDFQASDNFTNLKFDLGKYLSDRLYLGVSAQTNANVSRGENPWAARLEYQLPYSFSLEAYAGTAPAAGADIVWSIDF